jgi:LytR cell envelope-related transcriptional attenuator
VLVLNGNGVSGAAGAEASRLLGRGYRSTNAVNAPVGYATSLVLFRPGWQREGERLGRDARTPMVAPLDGTLPRADAGYELVLILGAN